jgi:LmbE family N-acetylglucosaminyl deacetylase
VRSSALGPTGTKDDLVLDLCRRTGATTYLSGTLGRRYLREDRFAEAGIRVTYTRPTAGHPVREVYAFEVPSSTEWGFGLPAPAFTPNVFVDVEATLETKVAAMQTYESEARPFAHPRSSDALRAIARRWGSVAGLRAAEAFQLPRAVR